MAQIFARYVAGMKYGPHTDAAFLPLGQEPLRSDVSHQVVPASSGERIAMITFIES